MQSWKIVPEHLHLVFGGVVTNTSGRISLSPQNRKESELYITTFNISSSFWWKDNFGTTFHGVRVNHKKPVVHVVNQREQNNPKNKQTKKNQSNI